MKKFIENILKNYILVIAVLIIGLFTGWLLFHAPGEGTRQKPEIEGHEGHDHESADPQMWTCSMHPQIRQSEPGKCPICAMDLIPLTTMQTTGENIDPNEIMMSESAAKLASIQTQVVSTGVPEKNLHLQGKVQPDERKLTELTARFGGRIEQLFINFTGQDVRKGQKLATIYSPELVAAQKELIEAISLKESRPSLYNAARAKLRLWDLTEEQIADIEEKGEPQLYFDVLSPISGTVTMRHVAPGDYVKEGTQLFKVVDLTSLWVLMDAYESDLPWIKLGDRVDFTVAAVPGKEYSSKVSFIDPVIDGKTRVAGVRIEIPNHDRNLKPGMFINATLKSKFGEAKEMILIPKSAVLWTGKRSIVYIKVPGREDPSFLYREIELGPDAGDSYVVTGGLAEGEEIVTNGVFKVDASAQLIGLVSMMNPEGGVPVSGHNHGELQRGDIGASDVPVKFRSQFTSFYRNYLRLKDAFVGSDISAVKLETKRVLESLTNVDMKLVDAAPHMEWMDQSGQMGRYLAGMTAATDIARQRLLFSDLNKVLYRSVKTFGLTGVTTYYQYCPMANGGVGAYWFSDSEEIRNPYFGDEMLTCGEVKEVIEYREY